MAKRKVLVERWPPKISQGYCVMCKKKRTMMEDIVVILMSTKERVVMKGSCPMCGTGMVKFL